MCSCLDDRKITGSLLGATNLMVLTEGLKTAQGSLKTYSKTAESGNKVTSYFCSDCGSTLYRVSSGFPGVVMMKAGCIDDLDLDKAKPVIELFRRSHVAWVPEINGIEHNKAGLFDGLVDIYS